MLVCFLFYVRAGRGCCGDGRLDIGRGHCGCCGVGDCDGQCVLWCGCCGCDIGAVISLCPLVGMYVFEFVVFYLTCLLYRCEPMFCFVFRESLDIDHDTTNNHYGAIMMMRKGIVPVAQTTPLCKHFRLTAV